MFPTDLLSSASVRWSTRSGTAFDGEEEEGARESGRSKRFKPFLIDLDKRTCHHAYSIWRRRLKED